MYGETIVPYDRLQRQVLEWCDWALETDCFVSIYPEVLEAHRSFQPFDDIIPALKALKSQGWKICLMSNTTRELLSAHHQALDSLPDGWLCADETCCYKPELRFFQIAQDAWNLQGAIHIHIA